MARRGGSRRRSSGKKRSSGKRGTSSRKRYVETVYTYGDYRKEKKVMTKYHGYKNVTAKKGTVKLPNGKKKTVYHIYGEK